MTTIEEYTGKYEEDITSIERLCFSPPWGLDSLVRSINSPNSLTLIAIEDGTAIGYACALVVPPESEVLKVAVLPERQGKGIGKKLTEELAKRLRMIGITSMHLEARESNRAARILYEKCGFRQVGIRSGYYTSPPEDAVLMKRNL